MQNDPGMSTERGGSGGVGLEETLTVMFEDLEGSTALAALKGDAAWREARRAHEEIVRASLRQFEGREVQYLGDGFLLAFSSARRGLGCAVDIQRRIEAHNLDRPENPLRVHIGLHSGEVFHDGTDLVGAAVNGASRISTKARGGQILVSETVRDLAGPIPPTPLADRGLFWLKGFPDRWRLYEALWRDREPPGPGPLPPAQRSPFVGRDDEYADLRRCLDRAEIGEGDVVLIGGEPGVGKTRMVQELMAEADARGTPAFMGRCYETEAPPYIVFVEIFESAFRTLPETRFWEVLGEQAGEIAKLLPDVDARLPAPRSTSSMPPEQARRYLFNSMTEVLRRLADDGSLLLVLDDLQWADRSSLLFLEHLAARVPSMPILVVGTFRDSALHLEHPLAITLERLHHDHVATRHALHPLPIEAVQAMLRIQSGREPPAEVVRVVYRETDGNPLFVEEVYRHLAEERRLFDERGVWRADVRIDEDDVPDSLRLVLGRRVAGLSKESQHLLQVASVIGRGVSLRVLDGLGEVEPELVLSALEEAQRAGLITLEPTEPELRFSHELIRQTLLAGLSVFRRRALHARVAAVMEEVFADSLPAHVSDVAYHLLQGGSPADREKTVQYLVRAGEQALLAAGYEDALHNLETAMGLGPSEDRTKADLLFALGSTLRSLGRMDEGIARWREAITLYETLGEADAAGHACAEAVAQLNWAARWEEALEMSGRGLNSLGERPTADRSRLLINTAVIFSAGGNHDIAAQIFRESLELARRLGDDAIVAHALSGQAIDHVFYMHPEQAAAVGLESASLCRKVGDLWTLAEQLSFVQLALVLAGDLRRAERIGAEAEELATRLGHYGALMVCRGGGAHALSGDLDLLESFANSYLELAISAAQPWTSAAYAWLGLVAMWKGNRESAVDLFGEAISREVAPIFAGSNRGFLMLAYANAGDRTRVVEYFEQHRSDLPQAGGESTIGAWTFLLAAVEALASAGANDEAAALYPLVIDAMARGQAVRVYDLRLLDTLAGVAAGCGRSWADAERHFESALRRADTLNHRFEQADARRLYARMLLARDSEGDASRARELMNDAIARYRRQGMPGPTDLLPSP